MNLNLELFKTFLEQNQLAMNMGNNDKNESPRVTGAAKRKQFKPSGVKEEKEEVQGDNDIFRLLNERIKTIEKQEQLMPMNFIMSSSDDWQKLSFSNNEMDIDDSKYPEIEMKEEEDEWRVEYNKLEKGSATAMDSKDKERRRQMEKNREYARKCVQKKKDMRKHAEIRSLQISRKIQLQQKYTVIKERNANFAVELRKMMDEHGVEEERKSYEAKKKELMRKFEENFSKDEAVNLNFHRLSSSREEFEKAAIDLRNKSGVIGTLGSRKIRAKQQMEWRQHLYNISVFEHTLRREIELSKLADGYVKRTVPEAAPLVQSIPKHLLDELIKNDRTAELEEFYRFVAENSDIIDSEDSNNVIK